MENIKIEHIRNKKDLITLAEEYAKYYQNSVLKEKWTASTALKMFEYFYNLKQDLIFVAYDKEKPIGIIMTNLKPWWDGMHLEDGELFVLPEYRKRGIAKELLKILFQYTMEFYNATTLEAHTYKDKNDFPYCWYKKIGFETIEDWKIISGNIPQIIKNLK